MGQCLGKLDRRHVPRESVTFSALNPPQQLAVPTIPPRIPLVNIQGQHQGYNDQFPSNSQNQECPERVLVAAIDLGTTFSGYAFSFRHEYLSDRLRISTNLWPHNNGMSMKAPTSILLNQNGEVEAFGYEAIKMYGDLAEYNQHTSYYFFNKFKMNLYQQGALSTDLKLHDISGKTMAAVDIFAKVIGYLKQHVLTRLKEMDSKLNLAPSDIQWVVTVPAIWDDKAKFFMRKAAEKAGIEGRNLTLALEPEAASLFCRYSPTYQSNVQENTHVFDIFKPETKYMVVDLGGGTVDITVHCVHEGGALEELYQPTGGYWGGTTVDDEFCSLLVGIFGHEVYKEFQNNFTSDVIELFQEFDIKKRLFEPGQNTTVSIKISASLVELYRKHTGREIQEVLNTQQVQDVKIKRDKLQVSPQAFIRLFDKSISGIVCHIQSLLQMTKVSGVTALLLVGGYADSHVVRDAIVSHFPNLQIIHPQEAASTVLKGAVLFGHEPRAIVARVCKYTYGIAISEPFKEGVHDPDKKRFVNDEVICDDVFDVHLQVGQQVSLSGNRIGKPYNVYSGHSHSLLEVYASSVPSPKYVTESWCTKLGSVVLELPPDMKGDEKIIVGLYYGGTELGVFAVNSKTGSQTHAFFDFLG
ncbi:heat shock 70 kDa protein 12B-like [Saccostrea cucullata]|uniref:heat shock 70 kDa protein 12B-like n=1 Tax=Saccostrea cuccullata TaxID=36930 RepID=UPI002ED0B3C0